MTEKQDFETEPEDVEGHRLPPTRPGVDTEDDVEGHRIKPGNTVQPGYDEDDVEGHVRRPDR